MLNMSPKITSLCLAVALAAFCLCLTVNSFPFNGLKELKTLKGMETDIWKTSSNVPEDWILAGSPMITDEIELIFAVKQSNIEDLENLLLEISDPDSPNYGKQLSLEEVHELVAPKRSAVDSLLSWLSIVLTGDSDVSLLMEKRKIKRTLNDDFIEVLVTVKEAEKLLSTNYGLYKHQNSNIEVLRCGKYFLPETIANIVDFVSPTVRFPVVSKKRFSKLEKSLQNPKDLFVTPEFLRKLYQVGDARGSLSKENRQGVASFLEQYYSDNDLQEFFKLFSNKSLGNTPTPIGGANQGVPGTEAELDVQYIMSVGEGIDTTVYYTSGRNPNSPDNEPFLKWLTTVNSDSNAPFVLSVSYGEDEKSVGYDYAKRVNTEFQKLGTRGISILFAAGDSGTGGNCTASKGRFNPNFPTGSPWVTSVGGVWGGTAGSFPTGEITDSISGGGFSDWWETPAWQKTATENYLNNKTGLPDSWRYNSSGRGYPDVAAQSEGFVVVQFGIPMPGVGGTSCATPTFSGVIGLLNEIRIKNKKAPLGFLNPWIYKTASSNSKAFNDITYGSNEGCQDGYGFPSRIGWDPATGWGSPNYSELSKIVRSLP